MGIPPLAPWWLASRAGDNLPVDKLHPLQTFCASAGSSNHHAL
jgi:hypothetical protein